MSPHNCSGNNKLYFWLRKKPKLSFVCGAFHHFRVERECNKETTTKGICFHKGMMVRIPVYALHHDPKIWPEPEKFNPYRFTVEEKAKHGPHDWIPFGSGPRKCIAVRLAFMEVKIAMIHLLRKYKIVRSVKTEVRLFLPWVGKWEMAQQGIRLCW